MTAASRTRSSVTTFLVLLVLVLSACGGGTGTSADTSASSTTTASPTTASPPPPASAPAEPAEPARSESMVLVDQSRSTDAGAATAAQTARILRTDVYVPAGDGPFPLIVFGHGLSGHPRDFTRLLRAWADAGYLVAAPAFPLTNTDVPESGANLGDVINQPGDVSFVIDEMARLNDDPGNDVAGLVDLGHVGVAGLSLGGMTTYAVAFNECCRDDRIDAAVVLAGVANGSEELGAFESVGDLPMLVMHGDADAVIRYPAAVESYALLAPPKYLVTLIGGGHAEPFADQSVEFAPIVDAVTVHFWDAYLDDDPDALAALVTDASVDGITTLEYDD